MIHCGDIEIKKDILLCSLEQSLDSIAIVGLDGRYMYVNEIFAKKYGSTQKELLGKKIRLVRPEKPNDFFYQTLFNEVLKQKKFDGILANKGKDGTLHSLHQIISPVIFEGKTQYFFMIGRDVKNSMKREQELQEIAYTDNLTKLYNRHAFEQLTHSLDNVPLTLVLCDIDYFKRVNDVYGHIIGDKVLLELAKLFQASLRKDDLIFRWGGEEFIFIIRSSLSNSIQVIEKIRQTIEEIFFDEDIKLSCSFGMTQLINDDIQKSIAKADALLYKSKNEGRNKISYELKP
jgi:diguanylate cyclase (GGDEF)-like protein/PAS domain S-box-containing protein